VLLANALLPLCSPGVFLVRLRQTEMVLILPPLRRGPMGHPRTLLMLFCERLTMTRKSGSEIVLSTDVALI
jgi:hypothetical protein